MAEGGIRAAAGGERSCRFEARCRLRPPWHAVRVTRALLHTQGGLVVDRRMRVLRADRPPIEGLHAPGGSRG